MKTKELVQHLQKRIPFAEIHEKFDAELDARVSAETAAAALAALKGEGFAHLSNLTCVDWIADERFDVTYNLWSYTKKVHITVKAAVSRTEPAIASVGDLWPQAPFYEREIHEMFGVDFIGNDDLRPMFLHNWKEIPPLRKDFDSEAYAKKAYTYKGSDAARGGK